MLLPPDLGTCFCLDQLHLDRIIHNWNLFIHYMQSKRDLGDPFVYYDIHLVRINSKQIIQFLRDLNDAAAHGHDKQHTPIDNPVCTTPTTPTTPNHSKSCHDFNQYSTVQNSKGVQVCSQISESLVVDVKRLIFILRENWNHKMNTIRVEIDSALSPLETTDTVLLGLLGDIYRYFYEFNNKPDTYATSQQYYERALSYVNDGLNRVPYALHLSNSDEDIYGIFLNYAVFCHESTYTHDALVLCTEAVELFHEFTPDTHHPTPADLSVIALIKFNQKKWSTTEKPTATATATATATS